MASYPASYSDRQATGIAALIQFKLAFRDVLVKRTLYGMGTLRKITSIVCVVYAALAQILFTSCTVQRDARMTVSL